MNKIGINDNIQYSIDDKLVNDVIPREKRVIRSTWILGTVILISFMYWLAERTNIIEIIFPEVAALTIGFWVYSNQEWAKNYFYFWLSPTLGAVFGVGVPMIFPTMQTIFLLLIIFLLTASMLYILNSLVAPSISAALLPVLLEVNTWHYILSVFLFTSFIALVKRVTVEDRNKANIKLEGKTLIRFEEVRHWVYIGIMLTLISLLSLSLDLIYIMAPPLIVTLYEITKKNSVLPKSPIRLILLMVLSSIWGVLGVVIVYQVLKIPLWGVAGITTLFIHVMFIITKLKFPPAAAIALLPTIIHLENLWLYPLQILLGISFCVISGLIYHSKLNLISRKYKPKFNKEN